MRIAIGGVSHETSTPVDTRTTLADFMADKGSYRGQEVIDKFRGTNICTGGFIEAAEAHVTLPPEPSPAASFIKPSFAGAPWPYS